MKPSSPAPVATVDEQNPWLGLVSFTEETRGYFHGREEEAAELGRRVQRKLLTILFGQSGLGKTSILQAGLVPRLRPEGFCPVYVRLDYSPQSPSPAEQIKRAVFKATEAAGTWTRVGSATTGETLWEFLHHRDDLLQDSSGRTLIPILIFDQFEEIFTLAQSDDAGRRRAQEFLADLSDLVENRPPAALEARIDRDEADAALFDFARADYRILISLREDYLAHLEGLKGQMPSVTQNRMRLARMSGAQAVAAVRAPAPQLVSQSVAEAIVRFVAGGTDLLHAEVEPSLLSLICRELNNTRLAKGHAEISADLLAGSRDTILSEFYERALVDQPPGVRIFIEDEMLTDSGFRESVAEERVRKGLVAAGAAPDALAILVNRRLLRVEDRLDLRRVEITHDVLCSVIASSRGVRRAREVLEESRRQLEAQKEREAATRRSLVRARAVAAISAVLMLVAAGSAVFGWINLRRARLADTQTQAARLLAEDARSESEKLVGFLLDEFYEELEPTGRVEIVQKLADRAVAYYDHLPAELVTNQTKYYHGMALVRKSSAMGAGGDLDGAARISDQAAAIFNQLRADGDKSEGAALGLALAKFTRANNAFTKMNKADYLDAAELLRPFVASGHAFRATKLALADTLNFLCHLVPAVEGVADCEESRKVLAGMGAMDLTDLTAATVYADVADSQARLEMHLDRNDEAARLETIVGEMGEKVLVKRPGDLRAMRDVYFAHELLGRIARENEDLIESESECRKALDWAKTYCQFNPADSEGWGLYSQIGDDLYRDLYEEGRLTDAIQELRASSDAVVAAPSDPSSNDGYYSGLLLTTIVEAELGQIPAAKEAEAKTDQMNKAFVKTMASDRAFGEVASLDSAVLRMEVVEATDDYPAVYALGTQLRDAIQGIHTTNMVTKGYLGVVAQQFRLLFVESELRTGRFKEAAEDAQHFVADPITTRMDSKSATRFANRQKVQLATALLELGRKAEAATILGTVVSDYRARRSKGASGTSFRQDYANALYQMARAQADDESGRTARRNFLNEASGVVFGLTPEAQELFRSKQVGLQIAAAMAAPGS
jgi:hypothetical protein